MWLGEKSLRTPTMDERKVNLEKKFMTEVGT